MRLLFILRAQQQQQHRYLHFGKKTVSFYNDQIKREMKGFATHIESGEPNRAQKIFFYAKKKFR